MSRRPALVLLIIAGSLAVSIVLHLSLGSVRIPPGQTIRVLLGTTIENGTWQTIVREFRLPRVLAATVAGAALGVGGLLMQTLFRNPLAGPFVLGINAGASLGVAIVVLGGSVIGLSPVSGSGLLSGVSTGGDVMIALAASLGAAAVLLVVLAVARRVESAMTLLVLGVLFSYAVNAGVSVLMHFSIPQEIRTYINWTFGSFAGVDRNQLVILVSVVLAGLLGAVMLIKPMNALLLGELYAASMGVHVRLVRTATVAVTAVLAGAVTAFCGPIAFVGIAVPHLARAILRDADHSRLLPVVILLGALTAVLSDLVASLPGLRIALPLNAVTALIGAPVVIAVIVRRGDLSGSFS